MFDRSVYVTPYVDRRPNYVTVTEKRAPTDESIRLLKEMESAAQSKVDQSIRLEGCPFDCVVHVMRDFLNDKIKARVHLNLNGKMIVTTFDGDPRDPKELPTKLVKAISDKIALECGDSILRAFNSRYAL